MAFEINANISPQGSDPQVVLAYVDIRMTIQSSYSCGFWKNEEVNDVNKAFERAILFTEPFLQIYFTNEDEVTNFQTTNNCSYSRKASKHFLVDIFYSYFE